VTKKQSKPKKPLCEKQQESDEKLHEEEMDLHALLLMEVRIQLTPE